MKQLCFTELKAMEQKEKTQHFPFAFGYPVCAAGNNAQELGSSTDQPGVSRALFTLG